VPKGFKTMRRNFKFISHIKLPHFLDSSLDTVIREPVLYKRLTFHNLISIFRRLGRLSEESAQNRESCVFFVTSLFFTVKDFYPHVQPPSWRITPCRLSAAAYLIHIFSATLHSWRPFLDPQPENAPCCGDRDPPNMAN
jgi:hypothetical protein